jgi:hypothetical protein
MSLGGSTPPPSAQAILSKSLENRSDGEYLQKGTDDTGKNPGGTVRMQAGCKQDASTSDPNGIPKALSLAWPNVPEHIRLAILALIEPYREQD